MEQIKEGEEEEEVAEVSSFSALCLQGTLSSCILLWPKLEGDSPAC